MPADLSQHIYEICKTEDGVGYTWGWGDSRVGSWELDGEATSISRYEIDFKTWVQRNLDNDHRRSVRHVWAAPEKVPPTWTGEVPE